MNAPWSNIHLTGANQAETHWITTNDVCQMSEVIFAEAVPHGRDIRISTASGDTSWGRNAVELVGATIGVHLYVNVYIFLTVIIMLGMLETRQLHCIQLVLRHTSRSLISAFSVDPHDVSGSLDSESSLARLEFLPEWPPDEERPWNSSG